MCAQRTDVLWKSVFAPRLGGGGERKKGRGRGYSSKSAANSTVACMTLPSAVLAPHCRAAARTPAPIASKRHSLSVIASVPAATKKRKAASSLTPAPCRNCYKGARQHGRHAGPPVSDNLRAPPPHSTLWAALVPARSREEAG